MTLDVRLAAGVVEIEVPAIDTVGGRAELRVTMPLGALRSLPGMTERLASWPVPAADGPVEARFSFPELDAGLLLASLGVEDLPETLTVSGRGELAIDPSDWTATRGDIVVPALACTWEGPRLASAEPLTLRLAGRRLTAEAPGLEIGGRPVEVTAGLDLAAGWRPGEPIGALLENLDAAAAGTIDGELLNPYLGGATASGLLGFELEAHGHPDRLAGRAKIDGPLARLVISSPYFTRFESPELELEFEDGEVFLNLARARLNQGEIDLAGYRERDGEIEIYVDLEDVRCRLDYGLGTVVSGDLQLDLSRDSRGGGRLNGRLIVDRALLRRDLNLERELLGTLLVPAGARMPDPDHPLAAIELDLEVATAEGVRIKNNLADLRATWSPLAVRGNLTAPRVDGRLDVEPGGFLYLYGQTARIDQLTVGLSEFPELPPELDLDMTTSYEDPSVSREGAGRFPPGPVAPAPDESRALSGRERQDLAAAGVASYYADQLVGRVGRALGGTRIEVAPLLVFGETDPGARLTVSQDLSNQLAVAVSVDLRSENRQTYILDLHEFRALPRLATQLFTNNERNQGITVQQTLELGGRRSDEGLPRIAGIRFEIPNSAEPGFDRKGLRSAIGLRKGDRWETGAELDVEVDVAEHLRHSGYPGAEVAARSEPTANGRVAADRVGLVIAIDPGPQVDFDFRGETIPRLYRRSIRRLYRSDFYQPAALEEMRREAVRALRGLGYRDPEVEISLVTATDGAAGGDGTGGRTVMIDARGGDRRPISAVELRGVPADVGERLAEAFAATADRIELAAALEDADRRLLGMLRGSGYPEATDRRPPLRDGAGDPGDRARAGTAPPDRRDRDRRRPAGGREPAARPAAGIGRRSRPLRRHRPWGGDDRERSAGPRLRRGTRPLADRRLRAGHAL